MILNMTSGFFRLLGPLLSAATLLTLSVRAELVPAARMVDWNPGVNVGVPGGIDQYLPGGAKERVQILDVTKSPYNADRTGATNAAPAIQDAINAAGQSGSVVYLPAGTYRCDSTLYVGYSQDGITIRGVGPETVIDSRAGKGISVGVASDYMWAWPTSGNTITAGLTKGSTQVTIGNTSEFAVGKMVHFSFQNDDRIPVLGVGGGDFFRRQMAMVTAKTATTLTFSPALHENYSSALIARANVAQLQTDYVGIEDLTIDFSNGEATFGIEFEQCYGCWIKGVRVSRATNYAFYFFDSLRCELRRSTADQRKATGTNGAGFLFNRSFACLIEDNIFHRFFPSLEVNQGSSGNVFAYNFCYDSDVYGAMGCAINSNHGPHNNYNLYEGNVSPNLQCDGYFGGASRDTLFRNWFHGTSPNVSNGWVLSLNRFTRDYSVVGNVFGKSGNEVSYSFGNPNMGNGNYSGTAQPSLGKWWADWGATPGPSGFQELDLDVEASTVRRGNYLYGGGVPATENLGSESLPISLFRSAKPSWFGDRAWPAVDPANPSSLSFDSIPAGYRFMHGTDVPGVGTPPVIEAKVQSPINVRIHL